MTALRKTTAKPKKPVDAYRRRLYGKIEVAKKALGLDDDAYRDIIARQFAGKTSRTQLGTAQLIELIEHFKSLGFKPKRKAPARAGRAQLADGDSARKIRALWISLYHLAVVSDPSERALAAFIKRQAGVDDARFLSDDGAFKVIEALKAWAARAAGVDWSSYPIEFGRLVERPRCRVIEAQWRIVAPNGAQSSLAWWVQDFVRSPVAMSHWTLSDAQADQVIEALGKQVREIKGRGK
ncbi:regulatory protein GemA [Thalassospira marina]|uniref:GemA protein n=1 Tax=Thalassospira marina TaxID=2048283 RepID=A0ABM6QBH5_9PROT|nr:regulatory protein GemA [Thalassospira marina]AUG53919.1 hypothetical protein CSC3H3_15240 [Thalassospira marina]